MQFNSFVFILMFLPITVLAYFLANKWKPVLGKLVLAVASVVFYAYSDWTLFTVLGISLVVNLAFAWALQRLQSRRRLLLIVPVLINVGLLLYFKYTNFLIGTVNQFAGTAWAVRDLVQPLGISFFHFSADCLSCLRLQGRNRQSGPAGLPLLYPVFSEDSDGSPDGPGGFSWAAQ